MTQVKNNVTYTKKNLLCTGCGICEDICPKKCITIVKQHDEMRPIVREEDCLGEKCGRCLKICVGQGVGLTSQAAKLFAYETFKEDKYIGRYIGLHTGYSQDEDIRYHSASGGMVSQFLIFLLEKNIIDGAVVTGFAEDHITPRSYIARTREEVLAARSSKYCPVALNRVGNEIVQSDGKYVIVGLPCHIQGFRKRAEIDRKFKEKVVGYFAIYCSSNRTFGARDYLLRHYKISKDRISYFAFRDNGCLGNLTIRCKAAQEAKFPLVGTHSTDCRELEISFSQYYGKGLRSFFKPHRCLTCIDHYGELADVCFGDIHIPPYSDDKIGVSSWIVRTEYWEGLFRQAANEGYIKMDDVEAETLNRSQATMLYPKSRRAKAAMNMDKILGRCVPQYDKMLAKPNVSDYVSELLCHAQRFVGRHRSLWFIIDLLNIKGDL